MEKSTSLSLIGMMRDATWTLRAIASLVIVCFGGLVTTPAIAAVKDEVQKVQWHKPEEGAGAKLSAQLQAVRNHLGAFTKKNLKGASLSDERKQLRDDAATLAGLDKQTQADFASVSAMIQAKHLPEIIVQREQAAETKYKTEMSALRQGMDAITNESDDTKAQAKSKDVLTRLNSFQMERSHQKFDPKNLPNRSLKPDLSRKPHTTKKAFAEAGVLSNPYLKVATTAPNFDYSKLPGASDPAYLAATTEVTLSPAIQAQAAALNYNPVQIFNWVRNNIQWQPTWGAVQNADLTLSAQRGNAFDIASLLIALLRASNIPARYVHGTINVPADKFRNWVGGFQNINSAVNYASAGGIPITSLVSGGQIATVQMEHIWVEAAINYFPSRGVINRVADTWLPMDASYKQYTIQPGLDPVAISGINPSAVAQQFISSGTVDTTNDYASGLNPAILQNALQTTQNAVQNYLSQNLPNATIGQVFGGSVILQINRQGLAASLPYNVVVRGASYGSLPSQLEQTITFALGTDALGDPQNPITLPWPELNNQQILLSFVPATAVDQQALQSLMPSGPITDASQLPTSIPAYLVNVLPQLKLNGSVISTGTAMTLGQDVTFVFTPNFVGRYPIQNSYDVIAGSYLDVAVVAGSVSPSALSNLQSTLQQTQAILQSNDPAQLSSLSQERLFGDLYQAGALDYYNQYVTLANLYGQQQGGRLTLAAGIGSFGYEPKVDFTFGVPRDIRDGGVITNIPIVNIFGYDGAQTPRINYVRQVGVLSSALEAAVPEGIFGVAAQQTQAISAATALNIASQQGQRIYHITQTNQATVLPLINHNSAVMQEIDDALSAGKEVITHTDDISVSDWTGAGYIILDPQTGDGAYKIGGGQNGGSLSFKAFSSGPCAGPGWVALTFASLFAALSVVAIFASVALFVAGLGAWAFAASLTGGLFAALAGYLGFDKVLLAGFRAAASMTLASLVLGTASEVILTSELVAAMFFFSMWLMPFLLLLAAIILSLASSGCGSQASTRTKKLMVA